MFCKDLKRLFQVAENTEMSSINITYSGIWSNVSCAISVKSHGAYAYNSTCHGWRKNSRLDIRVDGNLPVGDLHIRNAIELGTSEMYILSSRGSIGPLMRMRCLSIVVRKSTQNRG